MKYYIGSGIIFSRRVEPLIYMYIMIIIVIALSLIMFMTLFHYKLYYKVKGIVQFDDEKYYIRLYIPLDKISYLTSNDVVMIDKREFNYKIISVDENFFTDNSTTYQIINIEIDIPLKYNINNLSLDLHFLKENKRVIDYIMRR